MNRFALLTLAGILASAPPMRAQDAAPASAAPEKLEFEVASVKPSGPDARGSSMYFKNLAGDLLCRNMTLKAMIAFAYNKQENQVSGAQSWIESARYDIDAKAGTNGTGEFPNPNSLTDEQREVRDDRWRERLRQLLAERFQLKVHHETKDLPVLELSVAGDGPRLHTVDTLSSRVGTSNNRGKLEGFSTPIIGLIKSLSDVVGRPVVDKTGLTGKYDYVLEWTPEPAGGPLPAGAAAAPKDDAPPDLFTALREQLGMKLKAARGPVDTIVIDQVEKATAN